MKYAVRAVKYFFYYIILLSVILTVLRLLHVVGGDLKDIFRNGYDSLWQIAVMFAVVAAAYPYFGFRKQGVIIAGPFEEIRPGLVALMEERDYELEKEDGENLAFRLRNRLNRAARMWEDRITFERDIHGFILDGPTRDTVRIKSALEYKFRNNE